MATLEGGPVGGASAPAVGGASVFPYEKRERENVDDAPSPAAKLC